LLAQAGRSQLNFFNQQQQSEGELSHLGQSFSQSEPEPGDNKVFARMEGAATNRSAVSLVGT
jgi:hypothetical protein